MRRKMRTLMKTVSTCGFLIVILYFVQASISDEQCEKSSDGVSCKSSNSESGMLKSLTKESDEAIHLSVVACGERLEETLVMIKSATLLTRSLLHVHIFADDNLRPLFKNQLDTWPESVKSLLKYSIYPIQYPEEKKNENWKQLFKLCASQRLFLPELLKDLDALIYVDTDILFLRPLDDVWDFLKKFNSTQIAAMAPEHEEPSAGWYNRFARHPYVPPYGINSGVMLMNLTRMREAGWLKEIIPYYEKYRYDITWGDQDLINIFFHFYPEKLYQYSCQWNYRPDHCMYMSNCRAAEREGISVIHGNRGVYHNDKQPIFKAVYQAIRQHKFGDDLKGSLLEQMKANMKDHLGTACGQVSNIFTRELANHVDSRQSSV